jgi:hypothetical protein
MKGLAITAEREKPILGVLLPGTNALEIFAATAETVTDFDFFVYIPRVDFKAQHTLNRLGVRYTSELNFFILHAPTLDAALTFGCLPHPAHNNVLLLTGLLKELAIPVLDIQHGLYQWGINFTDTSLEQGFAGEAGISLPMKTQADYQVTWAGENAVGYPRCKASATTLAATDGPILIATNTNWHIYSEEDRQTFIRTLHLIFTRLESVQFVWKPHPAEMSPNNIALNEFMESIRQSPTKYRNVEIFTQNKLEPVTLTDLIRGCRAGIATVGTSVIDFEMLGKPCAIFDSPTVRALNDSLSYADRFHNFESLLAWFDRLDENTLPPVTGQLKPFSESAFSDIVNKAITLSEKGRSKVGEPLPIVLKYTGLSKALNG